MWSLLSTGASADLHGGQIYHHWATMEQLYLCWTSSVWDDETDQFEPNIRESVVEKNYNNISTLFSEKASSQVTNIQDS